MCTPVRFCASDVCWSLQRLQEDPRELELEAVQSHWVLGTDSGFSVRAVSSLFIADLSLQAPERSLVTHFPYAEAHIDV